MRHGMTGCGKPWLACAPAHQAARSGFPVLYVRAKCLVDEPSHRPPMASASKTPASRIGPMIDATAPSAKRRCQQHIEPGRQPEDRLSGMQRLACQPSEHPLLTGRDGLH
jgi:hypothetical protein